MVTNEAQAESVLYGDRGAVSGKVLSLKYYTTSVQLIDLVYMCL